MRIGINGLGRIGRGFLRATLAQDDLQVVAVNDVAAPPLLAHLLKHDSLYGTLPMPVTAEPDGLRLGPRRIRWTGCTTPEAIPWAAAEAELVIEATGRFARRADAAGHLRGGARRVVISSPSPDADLTICCGVNDGDYRPAEHVVISNASCTTNAMAVVLAVADGAFGIERGSVTTVHCVTSNQMLSDAPHADLRRARAALMSMIPTSTSAAEAIVRVLPGLAGRISARAVRVPTSAVSLLDLTLLLRRPATVEEVRAAYRQAAKGSMAAVLGYSDEPLVSIDYLGETASAVIDGPLIAVDGERWVKLLAWYDNERGYVQRLGDLVRLLARGGRAGSL